MPARQTHPALAAHVLKALQERNHLDPALVDDVIMGCVMQVGEQSLNIGRNCSGFRGSRMVRICVSQGIWSIPKMVCKLTSPRRCSKANSEGSLRAKRAKAAWRTSASGNVALASLRWSGIVAKRALSNV